MMAKRVPIIHGWCKFSVCCWAFVGTPLGSRALRRHLWSAAAGLRAWQSHAGMRQRDTRRAPLGLTALGPILVALLVGALPAWAQFVEPPNPLGSLKTVPTP